MSRAYAAFAGLAVPILCLAVAGKAPIPGAAAAPLIELALEGLRDVTGAAPATVAAALSILAGWGVAALLAPRGWGLAFALPGLALAAATGPGEGLLCLCALGLSLSILRLVDGQDLAPLMGAGIAMGAMPLVHPAGYAFTLMALPVLAAGLPAPLIAGRAAAGVLLLLGVPALGLPLSFALLAWRYAVPLFPPAPPVPAASLAALMPRLAPVLLLAALALLPPGPAGRARRLATCALLVLPIPAVLFHGFAGGAVAAAFALAPALTVAGLIETRRPLILLPLIWGVVGLAGLAAGGT